MSDEKQSEIVGDGSAAGRAKGGFARAQKMTAMERRKSSSHAATERWKKERELADAVCGSPDKPLRIGDIEIGCYVLADGTRVLTQADFLGALGRHRRAKSARDGNAALPPILQGKTIAPYIPPTILDKAKPITFSLPQGGRASGYNAELLPEVCEVYLKAREGKAREGKALSTPQEKIAMQAEIIMRGLATVGIIALVDEATGYQDIRARDALATILEEFIAKEIQAYVQTFPPDFYGEMFRLRGLPFPVETVHKPQYFGHLTNDVVYKRLAPGVLAELQKATPKDDKGRRKHKYFQRLTANIGYPKLREHLGSVVTLMKISADWDDFMVKLDQIHPRVEDTIPMKIDDGSIKVKK
ncbi:MAG TPA: P63C domain-containing protein [Solirubrobacterales bacterium]|nr:P63C domain-containing protein [Solirubrobacterales bacterium]